jgi:ketosteroid isomerase-like protein
MEVVASEVRAAEEAFLEALGTGDVRGLDRLIADQYVHTGPCAETSGKPETLHQIESRAFIVVRSELSHMRILPYGDPAVVVGETAMTLRIAEQLVEGRDRFTRVWHRTDTGWRLVATHISLLGSDPRLGHPVGR